MTWPRHTICFKKSDNLQYNWLVPWFPGTNNLSTKCLMFQALFFFTFTKVKTKSFECLKSMRNYKKDNTWNIRHLVEELFGPSTQ